MLFLVCLNWNSVFECSDDLHVWYQIKAFICSNMKANHTWKQSIWAYSNHILLQIRCTFSVRTALKFITCLIRGLSHLRKHKLKRSFQDTLNPFCGCIPEMETTIHYLLYYPTYQYKRLTLFTKIRMKNIDISDKQIKATF